MILTFTLRALIVPAIDTLTLVITVLVTVTHHAASAGIAIGCFAVDTRDRRGHDGLGMECCIVGRRPAFHLCKPDRLLKRETECLAARARRIQTKEAI